MQKAYRVLGLRKEFGWALLPCGFRPDALGLWLGSVG